MKTNKGNNFAKLKELQTELIKAWEKRGISQKYIEITEMRDKHNYEKINKVW